MLYFPSMNRRRKVLISLIVSIAIHLLIVAAAVLDGMEISGAAFVVAVVIDQFAIDGVVNGAASTAQRAGRSLRRMSDGSIATYGLWMGAVTALLAFLWMWGASA